MSINKALFSSDKDHWETPDNLFKELNKEFMFCLDVASSKKNTKCLNFYTKEDNGLKKPWGHTNWCNPPYGSDINQWIEKAILESTQGNLTVMLLPARTDTRWFHRYIYNAKNVEIRFLKGRLKFTINGKPLLDKKGNPQSAPFPSMIVIFRGVK